MIFLAPGYLWALAALWLVWFLPRRVQDVRHGVIRTLVFAALIFALARPVSIGDGARARHVLILDESASVQRPATSPSVAEIVRRWRRSVDSTAHATVIRIQDAKRNVGDAVSLESDAGDMATIDAWIAIDSESEDRESSSLSTALELAALAIPVDAAGSVTVASDGLATDPLYGLAFEDLTQRAIPVHAIDLRVESNDPRIVGLSFEDVVRVGHTATARIRVSGRAQGAKLVLEAGAEELKTIEGVSFDGTTDTDVRFEPPAAGFHDITVRLVAAADPVPETNRMVRRIAVQDPLRVLYLGQRMQGARDKLQDLLGKGFDVVDASGAVSDANETQGLLATADVVVLDDRPARDVPAELRSAIRDAVAQRGLGLFASGGRAAFGSGGYHRTEIEDMLPIEFVQKEEKKDPSTTLAIIIDSSGSMVGNRMTLAKQVARLAMRRLQPHDKIGIVEFYGTKSWAAPIQSAANQIDLQRALNRLDAGGGTVLMPAIEEAYYALKNVETRYKHVLVLTDAGVETGDYESLLRRMADEGITVSTVLVGPGRHGDFLVDLADWGGGRYYNAADRFNLPELLLKKPSTSVLPAYRPERTTVEASGGPGWWGDLDVRELPQLDGFVESELRPNAELLVRTQQKDMPILATRLSGLGRVTAMMTEPLGPGSASWADWSGYGGFLGRVLARTARGAQPPFRFEITRRRDRVRIEATRLVRNDAIPHVAFVAESDGLAAPELRELAPGTFRAEFPWPIDRVLEAEATADLAPQTKTRLVSGAFDGVSPELQVDPSNAFPFAAACEASGGNVLDAASERFEITASIARAPRSVREIWPWCALLALLLYVLDVFHRRSVSSRAPSEIA
ncbi:MAG: VWA domain-containing protein [Planctomycetes bacterium]|nr:VWA domain-containing protein [Planctomycetota bacterium]